MKIKWLNVHIAFKAVPEKNLTKIIYDIIGRSSNSSSSGTDSNSSGGRNNV